MNPEITEVMMLRRVSEGGISVRDGGYTQHGRPITGRPAEALVRLHTGGYFTLGEPDSSGHRPVRATAAGLARLTALDGGDG